MKHKPDHDLPDVIDYKHKVLLGLAQILRQEFHVKPQAATQMAVRLWKRGVVIA